MFAIKLSAKHLLSALMKVNYASDAQRITEGFNVSHVSVDFWPYTHGTCIYIYM